MISIRKLMPSSATVFSVLAMAAIVGPCVTLFLLTLADVASCPPVHDYLPNTPAVAAIEKEGI